MDLKSLEARIQHLEDVEAIRTLKALCCHVVDIKFWPFMVHFVMNPIIDVRGDHATGQWYCLRP